MPTKLARARLAIPRVNQQPRVNDARRGAARLGAQLAKGAATKTSTLATSPSQPSNAVPSTQSAPMDPFKADKPAPNPDLFAPPSYTPSEGQPDPRDPTYWANLSKLIFTGRQEYAKNVAEQTTADSSYGQALQTAIQNRALQQRSLGEDAIRGNLGASGWLNRTEGQQTTQYTNDRSAASLSKSQEDQAREAARQAIVQGYGIDAAAELAAAAARYSENAANAAQNAEPEAPPLGGSPFGNIGNGPVGGMLGGKALPPPVKNTPINGNPTKTAIAKRRKVR